MKASESQFQVLRETQQESLALASMVRGDSHASSMVPASSTAANAR